MSDGDVRQTISVSGGTEKYKEYNPSNSDGSQTPAGILWDKCDATAADQKAAAVVRSCVVNKEELTWFAGATTGQKNAALYQLALVPQIIGRAAI